ncbi:MAG: hypothetical protein ACOH1O_04605 [Flavobacterium sp.]
MSRIKSCITVLLLLFIFSLSSCAETNTTDAVQAYTYWACSKPSSEIKLIKGQYWQSPHWSKEYILYLKFKPSKLWRSEFIKQNNLVVDETEWTMPMNSPSWFNPSEKSIRYSIRDNFGDSSYFFEVETGIFYIYEIQL